MKYYYLDKDKKPQGPYSESEIQSFIKSGMIENCTLGAMVGDANWEPIETVLKRGNCSMWNKDVLCPHCKTSLQELRTSEICAYCGKKVTGYTGGVWGGFVYSLKNAFVLKGRANRTEFWGYFLFSFLIQYACNQILNSLISTEAHKIQEVAASENTAEIATAFQEFFSSTNVQLVCTSNILISFVFFIPFISVSVRRMHDTGSRGTSVFIATICMLIFFASSFKFHLSVIEEFPKAEQLDVNTLMDSVVVIFTSGILLMLLSIYLFIKMLLPGSPAGNKFGPQSQE